MKEILSLLSKVYNPQQIDFLKEEIQILISKYHPISQKDDFSLTEKDVVLISYGDTVYSEGESKLQTLNTLLLKHLKEVISIVHILPFYPSSSDDGFAVIDYYKVDPNLGTWDDIEIISKDFRLLFDAVVNHSSKECNWFKKFLADEENYKDYYVEMDEPTNYRNVIRPRTTPLSHTYKSRNIKKEVWTTFSEDQVDFNFKNPQVFIQFLDLLLFYISKGAQIIRLDAVGFIWKEKDTTCMHLPQVHLLIKALRKVTEEMQFSTMFLSETNVPHHENISYFGNGNEAHMVYNFPLPPLLAYSLLSGNTKKLVDWAQTLGLQVSNVCFFNFLASHDGIGLRPVKHILNSEELDFILNSAKANGGEISYKVNPDGRQSPYEVNCNYFSLLKGPEQDESLGIRRIILAHAILLAIPGLPAIYFHSMFGSENDLDGMKQSGINRRINRQKLEYDNLTALLNDPKNRQTKILYSLKQMIQIRKSEPAFNPYNPVRFGRPGKGIFCIERTSKDGKSKIQSYYNFSNKTVQIQLNRSETSKDLFSNNYCHDLLELNPLGFKWLKMTQ